mgnify:CR=1 FL=1
MKFKVFRFNKVKSTNNTAIRIIKKYNYDFGMVLSELQISGRGQYGKKWISYKGNLFVTIFFNISRKNISIKKVTYMNCKLIKKLLSRYYKKEIKIKHPNDLFINKSKISGILQEIIQKGEKKFLLIGVGINLVKNPDIKDYPSTNLENVLKKKINKKQIIDRLRKMYETFIIKFNSRSPSKII